MSVPPRAGLACRRWVPGLEEGPQRPQALTHPPPKGPASRREQLPGSHEWLSHTPDMLSGSRPVPAAAVATLPQSLVRGTCERRTLSPASLSPRPAGSPQGGWGPGLATCHGRGALVARAPLPPSAGVACARGAACLEPSGALGEAEAWGPLARRARCRRPSVRAALCCGGAGCSHSAGRESPPGPLPRHRCPPGPPTARPGVAGALRSALVRVAGLPRETTCRPGTPRVHSLPLLASPGATRGPGSATDGRADGPLPRPAGRVGLSRGPLGEGTHVHQGLCLLCPFVSSGDPFWAPRGPVLPQQERAKPVTERRKATLGSGGGVREVARGTGHLGQD